MSIETKYFCPFDDDIQLFPIEPGSLVEGCSVCRGIFYLNLSLFEAHTNQRLFLNRCKPMEFEQSYFCPNCKEKMVGLRGNEKDLFYCNDCNGIWLPWQWIRKETTTLSKECYPVLRDFSKKKETTFNFRSFFLPLYWLVLVLFVFPFFEEKYNYYCYHRYSKTKSVHEESYLYTLPYEKEKSYEIIQSFHGDYSHTGFQEYAIDFAMPTGTIVCSSRDGYVVDVITKYNKGGPHKAFLPFANLITISHKDGTVAIYAHLKQGGSLVQKGDFVKQGQKIGYSGNTGFSGSPHLHFAVFKTYKGTEVSSIPIKFKAKRGVVLFPSKGDSYEGLGILDERFITGYRLLILCSFFGFLTSFLRPKAP